MKIHVMDKDMLEIQADACVSPVHRSKNLKIGKSARLILQKGGKRVQESLKPDDGKLLSYGDIKASEPGNLSSKFRYIFFVCLPQCNGRNGKEIRDIVFKCCQVADGNYFEAIVFPCLGTGGLGFPEEKACHGMIEGLVHFAFHRPESPLTVYVSVYQKPLHCMRRWDEEFRKWVSQYNEFTSGENCPDRNFALTEIPEPGRIVLPRPSRDRSHRSRSLQNSNKSRSLQPINGSSSSQPWKPLPSACSFSSNFKVGPVHGVATSSGWGRLRNDEVDIDYRMRVRLKVGAWIRRLLSFFY